MCQFTSIAITILETVRIFFGQEEEQRNNLLFRHHGGEMTAPLKPLEYHGSIVSRSLRRGALNSSPIIPRGVSLSDSVCDFFGSRIKSPRQNPPEKK